MCAGALVNARIRRLYYGCDDPKAGAARTLYRLLDDARLNHQVEVIPGVLAPRAQPCSSRSSCVCVSRQQISGSRAAEVGCCWGRSPPALTGWCRWSWDRAARATRGCAGR